MLLRKFNRPFSEKINVFLVNNAKNLVRFIAKDKVFLRKKVVNQWNNSLFSFQFYNLHCFQAFFREFNQPFFSGNHFQKLN